MYLRASQLTGQGSVPIAEVAMSSAKAAIRSNQISVHVVEQHALAMGMLYTILKRFHGAEFHCDVSFSLASDEPLVLVVDAETLRAPLGQLLRQVRLRCARASVIVLNSEGPVDYLVELLYLGVRGFVAYDRAPDELVAAINTVARGGAWIDANTLQEFSRQKFRLAKEQHKGLLTQREMTVLGLLERGFCNKEIASTLGISVPTVKFHLRNIFAKSGVHDRAQAVEWAKRSGAPKSALGDASGG